MATGEGQEHGREQEIEHGSMLGANAVAAGKFKLRFAFAPWLAAAEINESHLAFTLIHGRLSKPNLASESMKLPPLDFATLRRETVGADASFETPFGRRLMTYADYTASGRCLGFVERFLMQVQHIYANTHTEDDVSGRSMSRLLEQAGTAIKDAVNAGPDGKLIALGTGSTAAIYRFQQLIGVALPPVTAEYLVQWRERFLGQKKAAAFEQFMRKNRPVVFVGPFEHHSNEITWRESLAEVVPIALAADGGIDLVDLQRKLQSKKYRGRRLIGSFSAASNVTGRRTPVHQIARLLHAHDALAVFDYAACAPYVPIDMNPDPGPQGGDPSLDAIFVSPHKFIGGPGSSGVLVFNQRIYHNELPPSVGGGGTVDYVGPHAHDFVDDIEEREKAGTPGTLQTMKAALAFLIKDAVGVEKIEAREDELLQRALARWGSHPRIEILGGASPEERTAIISFNIRDPRGGYLHPKLLTVLLNDLFGIQSRAGCSCAGPYGHLLLDIDKATSERYRIAVRDGYVGIKPGWCRIGFHFTMDDPEADFLIEAVEFLAESGWVFQQLYQFDLHAATWTHREFESDEDPYDLAAALDPKPDGETLESAIRSFFYSEYLRQAQERATSLSESAPHKSRKLKGELEDLQFFSA
jgi:selenocysteine lyase/cysteine desulfurase